MKKILMFVFCSIFTLVSGVLLCSCDSAKHSISFTIDQPDFVTATVVADEVEVQASSSGKFEVKENSKIRVKFYAKQYGVDMSNIVVKANKKERVVQTYNTNFDSLRHGGDLYYGYILFNGLKEDVKIDISGADSYKNTFTFIGADLEDETSAERLKKASIKTPGSADFVNFFDFLGQEDTSFKIDIIGQGESGRSFQMKFDGGNPYEITTISPFNVELPSQSNAQDAEGQSEEAQASIVPLQAASYQNGVYTFQLGDIGNNVSANILTDFQALKCRDFDLNLPKANLTYQVTLDEERETFNFESEAKVTIKKTMAEAIMDKEVVKVYINEQELSPDTESEEKEDEITLLIPKGITPESTGGEDSYDLRVTGMTYGEKETFALNVATVEPHPVKLVKPEFFSVDDQGVLSDIVGLNDEGQVITFTGKKTALAWKYDVLGGHYITPFDIFDYDILKNDEKLFNLKEILDEGKQKDGFVEGQDIFVEKEGYSFRARYNSQTQKYDDFQIEFFAEEDLRFSFENFVLFEKNVLISFDFEDERVSGVEYAIGDAFDDIVGLEWKSLQKAQAQADKMKFGDVLFFKLKIKGSANVLDDGSEFILEPTIANQSRRLDSELLRENGEDYIILKFPLSDTYFDNVENMKLVLGRDLGQ